MKIKRRIASILFLTYFCYVYYRYSEAGSRILSLWLIIINLLYLLFQVYTYLVRRSDAFEELAYLSKRYKLEKISSVAKVLTCKKSIALHKKQNKHLKNKVERRAYSAIYEDINYHVSLFNGLIIGKKGRITNRDEEAIAEADIIIEHTRKLSELDNLYIEIETDAHINGTQRIDDLIASLKEMA